MARKRTRHFEWVRDDVAREESAVSFVDGEEEEDVGRPSPAEHAAAMDALRELANRLAALPASKRRQLPLEPDVLTALDELAALGHTPARRRQVHRVKGMLSHVDRDALEAALAGDGPAERLHREAERWRTRLLAGGDDEVQDFVTAHPSADRQALRASLRAAREPGETGARAARRVLDQVREALTASRAEG